MEARQSRLLGGRGFGLDWHRLWALELHSREGRLGGGGQQALLSPGAGQRFLAVLTARQMKFDGGLVDVVEQIVKVAKHLGLNLFAGRHGTLAYERESIDKFTKLFQGSAHLRFDSA